jgi:hypothetical protein
VDELGRVDTKPNNVSFQQNFTHPAFCLVYVKCMLENLHIILVSTLPTKSGTGMTEIMPVPRNLVFSVSPAENLAPTAFAVLAITVP